MVAPRVAVAAGVVAVEAVNVDTAAAAAVGAVNTTNAHYDYFTIIK